jgi:putative nucleotidyltransferase with HDIG domain
MGTLVAQRLTDSPGELQAAADLIGLDPQETRQWIARQTPCPVDALLRIAVLMQEKFESLRRVSRLEHESASLGDQVTATSDEISLLYCLIQNLRISADDDQLARLILEWLGNVAPCQGLVLGWTPSESPNSTEEDDPQRSSFVTRGQCPVGASELNRLVEECGLTVDSGPFVANRPASEIPNWSHAEIHSLIAVPVSSAGRLFGWLAAFNRVHGDGFRQVDANLFGSVATILGIHRENTELFHEQAEFVGGIVHALTSAIDAKDPYTCGHSDRVARMAVRLGQELGCTNDDLKNLYLAGLLHDIGKIGVEDEVLRKEDELTNEEYAHIKRHSRIGCEILADLKQLKHVLPVVLHHHESWDGTGYPAGLVGKEIPRLARIIAVADAYDAMASDRPYRPGMPIEALESILRHGSGSQWDPEVITAYFKVRHDLAGMLRSTAHPAPLSVKSWT